MIIGALLGTGAIIGVGYVVISRSQASSAGAGGTSKTSSGKLKIVDPKDSAQANPSASSTAPSAAPMEKPKDPKKPLYVILDGTRVVKTITAGEYYDMMHPPSVSAASASSSASPSTPAPASPSATLDTDHDGLTDVQETTIYHTDPHNADTDGDGLTDYQEVKIYHTNPRTVDTDNDGLTDYQEVMVYHTDPLKADTDGDGFSDGVEVSKGYNPLGPGLLKKS